MEIAHIRQVYIVTLSIQDYCNFSIPSILYFPRRSCASTKNNSEFEFQES